MKDEDKLPSRKEIRGYVMETETMGDFNSFRSCLMAECDRLEKKFPYSFVRDCLVEKLRGLKPRKIEKFFGSFS